jgi:hypothetical protein
MFSAAFLRICAGTEAKQHQAPAAENLTVKRQRTVAQSF